MPEEPEDEDDDGLGGDEEFCPHGKLIDSEDCDDCIEAFFDLAAKLDGEIKP